MLLVAWVWIPLAFIALRRAGHRRRTVAIGIGIVAALAWFFLGVPLLLALTAFVVVYVLAELRDTNDRGGKGEDPRDPLGVFKRL